MSVKICRHCGKKTTDRYRGKYCEKGSDPDGKNSHDWAPFIPDLIGEQSPPKPSSGDCWKLVITDMEARRLHGIGKHGIPVQIFNGRNALADAYQEALDLCVYLRQAIEEKDRQ